MWTIPLEGNGTEMSFWSEPESETGTRRYKNLSMINTSVVCFSFHLTVLFFFPIGRRKIQIQRYAWKILILSIKCILYIYLLLTKIRYEIMILVPALLSLLSNHTYILSCCFPFFLFLLFVGNDSESSSRPKETVEAPRL